MNKKNKEQLHCYFRVSSSIQEKGASLAVQEKVGRKIAKDKGLEFVPYAEGSASSNSESLDKRPQLQKLILQIRDGNVKHLYAWDMDRLSRNKRVSSLVLMEMEDAGVAFYTDNGVVDTSVRDDMLMLEIKSLFASHDNALRTARMKQSKLYKIRTEGIWGGGQIPYGFTTTDKKLTPYEKESKWVKKMFNWFYDGKTVMSIKHELDKNNVIARRGGLFSTGSILKCLQNTHHVGFYSHTDNESGEVIPLTCPPIVDEKIWNAVQTTIKRNNARQKQNAKTVKNFYLLRHLIYCGHCESKIHGEIKPTIRRNVYFCPKKGKDWKKGELQENQKWVRGKVGKHGCDNTRSVNITNMDIFVISKVQETLKNSSLLKEKFKREILKEKQVGDNDQWEYERVIRLEKTKRNSIQKKVDEYRTSLATLETNLILNEVDDRDLSEQIKENLKTKFQKAKDDLDESRLKIQDLEHQNQWIEWLAKYQDQYLDWEKFSKEELQDAINKFVDKILVNWDGEKKQHIITIKFKLPLVDDRIDYNDPNNKSKGYKVGEGKSDLLGQIEWKSGRPKKGEEKAYPHSHSTVAQGACGYAFLIKDSDVFFSFDLTTRSASLNNQNYNEYQQFLYRTITELLHQGLNYKQIADWLNDNGYKTVRGKKFRNAHTHSIVKKKRISNDKFSKTYPSELSNISLEVYDKRLVNETEVLR